MPWLRHNIFAMPGALRSFTVEIAAFLILGLLLWTRGKIPVTAIVLLSAFLFWSGLSWFWTVDTLATGKYLRTAVPWTVLVICFCLSGADRQTRKAYFTCVIITGSLTGLVSLLVHQWFDVTIGPLGRYQWPYDHTAAFSGALVAPAVGLSTYLVARLRERKWRSVFLSVIMLIPVFVAFFCSGTRSPLLGIAVGIYCGLILILKDILRKALLLLGIILVFISALLAYQYYSTDDGFESIYTGSFGTRIVFGRTALDSFVDKPLTGLGAGAFPCGATRYEKADNFLQVQRGDLAFTTHSEPLQILSETGLPGLALWLTIHLLPLIALFRNQKRSLLDIIIVAALVAIFVDSCGSMSMRYYELPWHYAIVLGLGLSMTTQGDIGKSSRYAYVTRVALTLLIPVYILAFTIPGLRASLHRKRAWAIWNDPTRKREANACISYAKANSSNLFEWYYAAQIQSRFVAVKKNYTQAIHLREDFLKHFPGDFVNRQKLIKLCWTTGEWQRAFCLCVEGLQLNPHSRNLELWLKKILAGTTTRQLTLWCRHLDLSSEDTRYIQAWAAFLWGNSKPALLVAGALNPAEISIGMPELTFSSWFLKSGEEEKARQILQPSATARPADPRILGRYVELLSLSKVKSLQLKAAEHLPRLIRLGWRTPEAIGVAAPVYIIAATEESRRTADYITSRAVSGNPQDAELYSIRIETLLRLGHREKALQQYHEALRRFSATEQAPVIEAIAKKYELTK